MTIPEGVTTLGPGAFNGCNCLSKVTMPESLVTIGENAFRGCDSLKSITIPGNVQSIGGAAFSGTGITSVFIPKSVISMGEYEDSTPITKAGIYNIRGKYDFPFTGCPNLSAVLIAGDNPAYYSWNGIVYNKTKTEFIHYPPKKVGSTFKIDDGVTTVGPGAFYNCKGLTEVVLPDSVVKIDDFAFSSCSNMSNIQFSSKLREIGYGAFANCGITNMILPDTVSKIDSFAFESLPVKEFTFPASLKEIGYGAFSMSGITEAILPEGLTTIKGLAFEDCQNLKRVRIPASIQSIGPKVFNRCKIDTATYGGNNEEWDAIPAYSDPYTRYDTLYDFRTQLAEQNAKLFFSELVIRPDPTDTPTPKPTATPTPKPTATPTPKPTATPTPKPTATPTPKPTATPTPKPTATPTPKPTATPTPKPTNSPTPKPSFSDMPVNQDFVKAINWAVEQEITTGTGGGQVLTG